MAETGTDTISMETKGGVINARRNGDLVSIDMGPAKCDWADIPLAHDMDTMNIDLGQRICRRLGVNWAIPCGAYVDDAEAIDLALLSCSGTCAHFP